MEIMKKQTSCCTVLVSPLWKPPSTEYRNPLRGCRAMEEILRRTYVGTGERRKNSRASAESQRPKQTIAQQTREKIQYPSEPTTVSLSFSLTEISHESSLQGPEFLPEPSLSPRPPASFLASPLVKPQRYPSETHAEGHSRHREGSRCPGIIQKFSAGLLDPYVHVFYGNFQLPHDFVDVMDGLKADRGRTFALLYPTSQLSGQLA